MGRCTHLKTRNNCDRIRRGEKMSNIQGRWELRTIWHEDETSHLHEKRNDVGLFRRERQRRMGWLEGRFTRHSWQEKSPSEKRTQNGDDVSCFPDLDFFVVSGLPLWSGYLCAPSYRMRCFLFCSAWRIVAAGDFQLKQIASCYDILWIWNQIWWR